jgi:hypothetical protein
MASWVELGPGRTLTAPTRSRNSASPSQCRPPDGLLPQHGHLHSGPPKATVPSLAITTSTSASRRGGHGGSPGPGRGWGWSATAGAAGGRGGSDGVGPTTPGPRHSPGPHRAGWNSSTRLPQGSSSRICRPPGPVTISLRNLQPHAVAADGGERRVGVLLDGEAELGGVEGNGVGDIVDHVADADPSGRLGHVHFPGKTLGAKGSQSPIMVSPCHIEQVTAAWTGCWSSRSGLGQPDAALGQPVKDPGPKRPHATKAAKAR